MANKWGKKERQEGIKHGEKIYKCPFAFVLHLYILFFRFVFAFILHVVCFFSGEKQNKCKIEATKNTKNNRENKINATQMQMDKSIFPCVFPILIFFLFFSVFILFLFFLDFADLFFGFSIFFAFVSFFFKFFDS